jgi:hypothetical protein
MTGSSFRVPSAPYAFCVTMSDVNDRMIAALAEARIAREAAGANASHAVMSSAPAVSCGACSTLESRREDSYAVCAKWPWRRITVSGGCMRKETD